MNHLENLKVLRQAVIDEPERLFSLSDFSTETPCGTLHCTAGLACTMPYFQAQGLQDYYGPYMPSAESDSGDSYVDQALNTLFLPYPGAEIGPESEVAYDCLFACFGGGKWDELFADALTHKQLAIARLDHAIYLWETAA